MYILYVKIDIHCDMSEPCVIMLMSGKLVLNVLYIADGMN